MEVSPNVVGYMPPITYVLSAVLTKTLIVNVDNFLHFYIP